METFSLPADISGRAKAYLIESLAICAHDHILSKQLIKLCRDTEGQIIVVAHNNLVLTEIESFGIAYARPQTRTSQQDRSSLTKLVDFSLTYLNSRPDAIIICENWSWTLNDISHLSNPPPLLATYGSNDVFHLLPASMTDIVQIETSLFPRHYYQTTVYTHGMLPNPPNVLERFHIDQFSTNAQYICVPAFDGLGFLIWKRGSPVAAETT